MYRAKALGFSHAEFWASTPRAILLLNRCYRDDPLATHSLLRRSKRGRGKGADTPPQQLTRIPR